jgi:gluconokinase
LIVAASAAIMIILIMGVSGSGKTTVGHLLAGELGWSFADADEFHPPANIAKMSAGQPLDDADRAPWLAALRRHIDACLAHGENTVVTCSALKKSYRRTLIPDSPRVRLVYLRGSRKLLWSRLSARSGHFMKPELLDSQLDALEPPTAALALDIADPPGKLVAAIRRAFSL